MKFYYSTLIIGFFLFCSIRSTSQSIPTPAIVLDSNSFKLIKSIPGNYKYFNVDILNNIFLLNKQNQLKKINENGDSISAYNNIVQYGIPDFIDVSNPFKILVYYRRFSTIVTLDRLLNVRNQINLKTKNIFSANVVATSYDNNIWLYDEQATKLKKMNDQFDLLLESIDFNLLSFRIPKPALIINTEKDVYLYDENEGLFIFDSYANYKNHLAFLHWNNITINNNIIYGFNKNSLFTYSLESLTLKEYRLPSNISNFNSIRAANGRLYLLKKEGIQIYKIE